MVKYSKKDTGWTRSLERQRPIDKWLNPWYTMDMEMTDFLKTCAVVQDTVKDKCPPRYERIMPDFRTMYPRILLGSNKERVEIENRVDYSLLLDTYDDGIDKRLWNRLLDKIPKNARGIYASMRYGIIGYNDYRESYLVSVYGKVERVDVPVLPVQRLTMEVKERLVIAFNNFMKLNRSFLAHFSLLLMDDYFINAVQIKTRK